MKKAILIMGSLVVMSLIAGSAFAWGPGHGRGMGFGCGMGFSQGADGGPGQNCPGYGGRDGWNDLSQVQKDDLTALRQKFIDETYASRSAMFQKQQEMRMIMETSNPDKARLDELSGEMADLQKQIRSRMIDFQLNAKKISPELGMGFGQGHGRGMMNRGGQRGCPGYGQGQGNTYNN